jgi:hypothetical protein
VPICRSAAFWRGIWEGILRGVRPNPSACCAATKGTSYYWAEEISGDQHFTNLKPHLLPGEESFPIHRDRNQIFPSTLGSNHTFLYEFICLVSVWQWLCLATKLEAKYWSFVPEMNQTWLTIYDAIQYMAHQPLNSVKWVLENLPQYCTPNANELDRK